MELTIIRDIDIENKTVLMRCDFNVPINEYGNIEDDRRIKQSLNSIRYCLENGCKIIIMSHLGRPKGEGYEKQLSMAPIARRLHALLHVNVILANDVAGEDTKDKLSKLKPEEILVLENLRFDKREIKDDLEFAKQLSSLSDVYINNAFGVSHRAHASVHKIIDFYEKGTYAAGYLLDKEIKFFGKIMNSHQKPFAGIVGGSKISGKLEALFAMVKKVDKLIIGGGMAFTFLKALGHKIGDSLVEDDLLDDALKVIDEAKKEGVKLYLPIDFIVADKFDGQANKKDVSYIEMPDGYMGLDIGKASVELFKVALHDCKTIIWNGPMGVFEIPQFAQGSLRLSHYLSALDEATTIVGGGDTASLVLQANDAENMTFMSTGGGASLELLEGKELPGVSRLRKDI